MESNQIIVDISVDFPPFKSVQLVQVRRAVRLNQGLTGIPKTLLGIPVHFQLHHSFNINYGNMSMNRKSRKIKPPHPDE